MDLLKDLKEGIEYEKDSIGDLMPYLLDGISYAIPVNSSNKLRMHFSAAIKKYRNPELSFEEIMESLDNKDYSNNESLSNEDIIRYSITNSLDFSTSMFLKLGDILNKKNYKYTYGELCYYTSMCRLKSSFKSAVILLRHGFFIEVSTVFRLIYEQLCWACFTIDEKDDDKINNNKTSKNTKYLKDKINPKYGRLYDMLSKEAHIAPNNLSEYIYAEKEGIGIRYRSGEKCKEYTELLILLFKIYIEVALYAINTHFELDDDEKNYYSEFFHTQMQLVKVLKENQDDKIGLALNNDL